jgi:hypothetical protein
MNTLMLDLYVFLTKFLYELRISTCTTSELFHDGALGSMREGVREMPNICEKYSLLF